MRQKREASRMNPMFLDRVTKWMAAPVMMTGAQEHEGLMGHIRSSAFDMFNCEILLQQ